MVKAWLAEYGQMWAHYAAPTRSDARRMACNSLADGGWVRRPSDAWTRVRVVRAPALDDAARVVGGGPIPPQDPPW